MASSPFWALPFTDAAREWATPATIAPSVTTIWHPSLSAISTMPSQNVRQRIRGSMPDSSTRSCGGEAGTM